MKKQAHSAWWQLWFQFFDDLFRHVGALGRELRGSRGRYLVLAVPLIWLTVFFLLPLLIVLQISFAQRARGIPPYSDLITASSDGLITIQLSLNGYMDLLADPIYLDSYLSSLNFASISTLLCLLIGYPIAYGITRAKTSVRLVLLTLVILPFWTSSLLRTFAMLGILSDLGPLNSFLQWIGLIDRPIRILDTPIAVYIGITYNYLPFMILPLVANLIRMDFSLLEAAADLGAKPLSSFFRITVPLSTPGIVAGSLLVFIPAVGEYVIPSMLGGSGSLAIGRQIWELYSRGGGNYPGAAALAMAMLAFIVIPMIIFEYYQDRRLEQERKAG